MCPMGAVPRDAEREESILCRVSMGGDRALGLDRSADLGAGTSASQVATLGIAVMVR